MLLVKQAATVLQSAIYGPKDKKIEMAEQLVKSAESSHELSAKTLAEISTELHKDAKDMNKHQIGFKMNQFMKQQERIDKDLNLLKTSYGYLDSKLTAKIKQLEDKIVNPKSEFDKLRQETATLAAKNGIFAIMCDMHFPNAKL